MLLILTRTTWNAAVSVKVIYVNEIKLNEAYETANKLIVYKNYNISYINNALY